MAQLSRPQPPEADVRRPQEAQLYLPVLRPADHVQAPQPAHGQTHQDDGTISVQAK